MERILVIGALGQLGTELSEALIQYYDEKNVLLSDLKPANDGYIQLDASDQKAIFQLIEKEKITQIYHLAAILSAKGEQNPLNAWEINMKTLLNVLEAGRSFTHLKIFWPSSIAVFGPDTPSENTPQRTIMNPTTVYGISKLAGEKWCEYYFKQYQVDVRSIRYPGLIGYKGMPGGGTTDYAVEIFREAVKKGHYTSFLSANTYLPMMYMPDAINATIQLMEAAADKINVRTSYNLSGFSFSPAELADAIKELKPGFEIDYVPDFRQEIANSWPDSVDDSAARLDWGWNSSYSLKAMAEEILEKLSSVYT